MFTQYKNISPKKVWYLKQTAIFDQKKSISQFREKILSCDLK